MVDVHKGVEGLAASAKRNQNMNKRRLRILAEIVEAVPPKQLNMYAWACETECGTVACAAGHACLSSRLRGLTLHRSGPSYKSHWGWPALTRYFGLTFEEAEHIFARSDYRHNPRPKTVAKRIRKLIGDA